MRGLSRILRNSNARHGVRGKPTSGGGGGGSVITQSDLVYEGAFALPRSAAGGQTIYGHGLTVRRESSDGTNPVHVLSAAWGSGSNQLVFEARVPTLVIPGGEASDPANYNEATIVKSYGDIYSSKKKIIYGGVETPFTNMLDGEFGLHWDETDGRLYWNYGFGYTSGDMAESWCMGYSTLDYAGETGTGYGPWKFYGSGSGQQWKSLMGGLVAVPQSYADSYLSGKRLAAGFGGYYSIIGSNDCSLGASLSAFDPAALPAAEGKVTSTPLVGYWPHASDPGTGKGRQNRVASAESLGVGETWGLDKHSWNDRIRGAVWIDTGTKRGVLFFGSEGQGRTQYLSSQIPSSYYRHFLSIYDPEQFTPVSATARYDIQPVENAFFDFPCVNYSQARYGGVPWQSVTGITSNGAKLHNSYDGCTVTCPNHGLTNGSWLEIRGASESDYNRLWQITHPDDSGNTGHIAGVIDANNIYIRNSSSSLSWTGTTPSGTIELRPLGAGPEKIQGATVDYVGKRLYVAVSVERGVNNISGKVMVMVFSIAGW